MNKSKKRGLLAAALMMVLLVSLPIIGSEAVHKELTLESLKTQILISNLDVKNAKDALMIAEYKEDEATDNRYMASSSTIETAKNVDYYVKQAEMNVKYAKWDLEETKQAKVLEGIELYYDYQLTNDEIKLAQQKVDRLSNIYTSLELKKELGTATNEQLNNADLEVKKAEFAIQQLINSRDQLFLDLNFLLNYELDTQLVLDPALLEIEAYTSKDLDADIKAVLETNGDLMKVDYQGDLAGIELNIYQNNNGSGTYDSKITLLKETATNYSQEYTAKKQSLEYDVRSKYNNLLNSYDAFVIDELELENLQLQLDVMMKRFEVGLQTQADVDLAQENLDFAKLDYEKSKLDYYIAVQSYKNFID